MSILKFAKVEILAYSEYDQDRTEPSGSLKFKRTAQLHDGQSSFYENQVAANKIDIAAMLGEVAEQYDISSNPSDYLFEAIRACTAGVSNENGDAFSRQELLRFDQRLARRVYQTFVLKPHHVNHRTDNAKAARGVILDAHYNDSTPPLEVCPGLEGKCGNRTAERENRDDATGLNCKKCGHTVKDEFVELFLAVDKKKDPKFADGVRTGALDSGSMGCECESTVCNVCAHRAFSKQQFCDHIRRGKKKTFKTASGDKVAFEWCEGVIFSEYSRVGQPADPKAKQREIFQMAASIADEAKTGHDVSKRIAQLKSMAMELAVTLDALDKQAQHDLTTCECGHAKAMHGRAFDGSAGDCKMCKCKCFKAPTAKVAQMAPPEVGAPAPATVPEQTPPNAQKNEGLEAIEEIKDTHPELYRTLHRILDPGSGDGQPVSITEFTEEQKNKQEMPKTPAEMGIDPDGVPAAGLSGRFEHSGSAVTVQDVSLKQLTASNISEASNDFTILHKELAMDLAFAPAYHDLQASVTPNGNIRVFASQGDIFTVRPNPKPVSKEAGMELADQILTSIANNGLVETAMEFNATFKSRAASVLDNAIADFVGGRKDGDGGPITEHHDDDKQPPLAKPPSATDAEHTTDHENIAGEGGNSVTDHHEPDHVLPDGAPDSTITGQQESDMAEKRKDRSVGKDHTIDDHVTDHAKVASAKCSKHDKADCAECKTAQVAPMSGTTAPAAAPVAPTGPGPAMASSEKCATHGAMDCAACKMGGMDHESNQYVKEQGGKWVVLQKGTGKVLSHHDTKEDAEASFRAMMMNKHSGTEAPADGKTAEAKCSCGDIACKGCDKGKKAAREEKLALARVAKLEKESAEKLANVEKEALKKVEAKFGRAIKLAALRQRLNLEQSPIKVAFGDALLSELDLGGDEFFPGMDSRTAVAIVETACADGFDPFVASLLGRAREFMAMSEEALAVIEKDASQNLQVQAPPETEAPQARSANTDLRRQASHGNMAIASRPTPEEPSPRGGRESRTAAIRSALSGTKVSRTTPTSRHGG